MSEWKKCAIGDVVTLRQGFAINAKSKHYISKVPTSLALLRIADMKSGSREIYVKEDIPRNFIAQPQDIVYTRTGNVGLVFRNNYGVVHNNCFTVTPNDEKTLSRDFLYYLLQSKYFFEKANSLARGAAQPDLPHSLFNSIEISYPDLDCQQRIADILSNYDSLIENYQKQIKLLEEAAQRLYKEWFVDLRFPGHEHTKIIDGVPDGWTRSSLEEICSVSKKVISPSNIEKGRPYIGLEHIPRKDFCLSVWGNSEDISSSKYEYKENDILFGKIRPYFHKVGFAINNGYASTDSIIMQSKLGLWGLLLMTVYSDRFVKNTSQACKEGAKMPRADWNQMKKYPILIASDNVQYTFERYIKITANRIKEVATQIRLLTEARDRLLPKLMSGEIAV